MQKQLRLKRWHLWVIVILPILGIIYLAWCYGLWGRNNLLLQYLFQCGCPLHSEPFRYPDQVEILIPACRRGDEIITVSPGGRLVAVGQRYILDLRTGERIEALPNHFVFVTDELLLVYQGGQEPRKYLLDIRKGTQSPVETIYLESYYPEGSADPDVVLPLLRQAERIFALEDAILLMGVKGNTGLTNYYLDETDWLGAYWDKGASFPGELSRTYLESHRIPYIELYPPWQGGLMSHNRILIAREDGIYVTATNQRIVETLPCVMASYWGFEFQKDLYKCFQPRGWIYDDRGVIMTGGGFLIDFYTTLPALDIVDFRFFWLPQPVLLLKVPPEYLSPSSAP